MTEYFYQRIFSKLANKSLGFLSNLLPQKKKLFPTMTYQFTKKDARRVYNLVLSGKLHHNFGKETELLEKEFAKYHHVEYALATTTGTAALELALQVLGVVPGDEVIFPAHTSVATVQAVLAKGGVPVFADIDTTFTISPESVSQKITPRTKAIIAVHMFGNVCDMDLLTALTRKKKIAVIEDCCQAVGASYKGKKVGSIGDVGCFSFNAQKSIFTGQGGMMITSKTKIGKALKSAASQMRLLHANISSDISTFVHIHNMTEIQSALACNILSQLNNLAAKRKTNFNYFLKRFRVLKTPFKIYRVLPGARPSYCRLVFMADFSKLKVSRKKFIKSARLKGIPLKTFYPKPFYSYSLFQNKRDKLTGSLSPFIYNSKANYKNIKLPFSEIYSRQQFGLEFSPYLTFNHIDRLLTFFEDFS